jgi:hypothetical protein
MPLIQMLELISGLGIQLQTSLTFQRHLTITKRKVFGIKLGKKTFTHTHKASTWPGTTSCACHMCRTAGWRWVFDWWSILNCGFFASVLSKLGTKWEIRRKQYTGNKKGDQTGFPTQISPHGSFTPYFGFALPVPPLPSSLLTHILR